MTAAPALTTPAPPLAVLLPIELLPRPIYTTAPNLEWLLAMEAYAVWECAKSVGGLDGVAQMRVWFAVMDKYPIFRQNVVGKYTRKPLERQVGATKPMGSTAVRNWKISNGG